MHALNRNLIALAMGAALMSPAAFAQSNKGGQSATAAGQATAETAVTTAQPTLPTQASPTASDAISKKTTDRETGTGEDTASASTDTTSNAGSSTMSSSTKATQEAMGATTNPGKGNWWKDADTDGDGKLSTTEANANAGLSSRFSTIDTDKDGFVTTEEYRTFYTANASQGAENAAAHSAVVTRDVWVKLDADADSRISLAEAAANADLTASFATMDSNSDGFVSQDEYTAYSKANK